MTKIPIHVWALLFAFGTTILSVPTLYAGPGDDHEHSASDHVDLTEIEIANLGIETVVAEIDAIQDSVTVVSRVELLPERQALVSPIFQGQVRELIVRLGDEVKAGDPMAVVEPLAVGTRPVTLKAPIDGVVSAQGGRIGEMVDASHVLFEVADDREVMLHGELMEGPEIIRIKSGQKATIVLDILGDRSFEGTVERAFIKPHNGGSTFDVFAVMKNPEGLLKPGLHGQMTIALGQPVSGIVIPRRAVLGDLGTYFVFVRNNNEFERRAVRLGTVAGPRIEILEGVFPGESVVVQGHYQLQFAGAEGAGFSDDHGHDH